MVNRPPGPPSLGTLARLTPDSSTVAPASPPYTARRCHGERHTGAGSPPHATPASPRQNHRITGHARTNGHARTAGRVATATSRPAAPAIDTTPANLRTQPG